MAITPPSPSFALRAIVSSCLALLLVTLMPLFSVPMDGGVDIPLDTSTAAAVTSLLSPFMNSVSNLTLSWQLKELTAVPHIAGTPANLKTAAFVKERFESFGLEAHYADFPVLLSYPLHLSLSISHPSPLNLSLYESPVPGDPYSSSPLASPLFLGYSRNGSLSDASVLYVNYGRTEDFEALARMGVNCSGAVALMRYGMIYRGNKIRNAARAGAIAAILFSDPADYAPLGTAPSQVYPATAFLPPSGGQRGSLLNMDGDPQTPGWPSEEGGERLSRKDTLPFLPELPAVPISYSAATHLLNQMGGREAPRDWRGELNLTYHVGPGPVRVNMNVQMNESVVTIRDVIAVIPGREEPDNYVILGNHRDAWVFGAADPNSGTTCLLEVARCLSQLRSSHGWQPRRSLLLASWDAEEYGLTGSTEWVESRAPLLSSRAAAYLNMDVAVCGEGFRAASTPQLDDVIRDVSKRVPDPETVASNSSHSLSLYDAWAATYNASVPPLFRLGGGGSDFAPFLQHLGVAAADMGFGAAGYATYHSLYDDYAWMASFGDPSFERHRAAARLWGSLALLLASLPALPFNYSRTAHVLMTDIEALDASIKKCITASHPHPHPHHAMLHQSDLPLTPSPLEPMRRAAQRLAEAARSTNEEILSLSASPTHSSSSSSHLLSLNSRLLLAERGFTDPQGLSQKDAWYRHLVYGPRKDDNYATLPFPALADALEAAGWRQVDAGRERGSGMHGEGEGTAAPGSSHAAAAAAGGGVAAAAAAVSGSDEGETSDRHRSDITAAATASSQVVRRMRERVRVAEEREQQKQEGGKGEGEEGPLTLPHRDGEETAVLGGVQRETHPTAEGVTRMGEDSSSPSATAPLSPSPSSSSSLADKWSSVTHEVHRVARAVDRVALILRGEIM